MRSEALAGAVPSGVVAERAVALDLARTVALLGMAVFHFVFDLVIFGHLPVEVVREGFWPLWARVVASSFLFLSGLHMIAFGTLAGLLFLRLPVVVTLVVAAAVFWIGQTVASPAFDAAPLLFLGLGAAPVFAVDYVPVFPWLCPVLVGVALGRVAVERGLWARIAAVTVPERSLWDWLAMPGRHSLLVYLIHQPVLIGAVWVWTFVL